MEHKVSGLLIDMAARVRELEQEVEILNDARATLAVNVQRGFLPATVLAPDSFVLKLVQLIDLAQRSYMASKAASAPPACTCRDKANDDPACTCGLNIGHCMVHCEVENAPPAEEKEKANG